MNHQHKHHHHHHRHQQHHDNRIVTNIINIIIDHHNHHISSLSSWATYQYVFDNLLTAKLGKWRAWSTYFVVGLKLQYDWLYDAQNLVLGTLPNGSMPRFDALQSHAPREVFHLYVSTMLHSPSFTNKKQERTSAVYRCRQPVSNVCLDMSGMCQIVFPCSNRFFLPVDSYLSCA